MKLKSALVCAIVLLMHGCAATSTVLVGKSRPAIAPADVKVYLTPPAQFEEVALLEASSQMSMAITDQGKMDAVILRLKGEAAKIGANGILLRTTGDKSSGFAGTMVGTGKSAFFAGGSSEHKNGVGIAIFVIKE